MLKTKTFFSGTFYQNSNVDSAQNVLPNTFDVIQAERFVRENIGLTPNTHPLFTRLQDEYRKMTNSVPTQHDLELVQQLYNVFNSAQLKLNESDFDNTSRYHVYLNEILDQILLLNRSGYHGLLAAIEAIIRELLGNRHGRKGEEVQGVLDFVVGIILLLHAIGRIIAGPPPKDFWDAVAVIGLAIIAVVLIVNGAGP